MQITTSKTGIEIIHDTGVRQTLSKEKLQSLTNDIQSQIDELESQKTAFQGEVSQIISLGG